MPSGGQRWRLEVPQGSSIRVNEAAGLLQSLDGGLWIAVLDVGRGLLDEAPAGAVWIPMLAVEEELYCAGEQLERLGEAPLCQAQRGLQIQKDGLVAQGILCAPGSRLPPGIRHVEAPLGSRVVAVHPACISQSGPGEAPKLVDPAFLEEATFGNPVRHMNGQVGEVDGLGRLLRRGLAALADQQLAQAPAHETRIGMQPGEAFLRSQGEKLLQEPGRFGARPCEGGVDESENRVKDVGLMKLEQPASNLSTTGANGEQVEELLVLLRRPVCGQLALQGGGIEMSVLHAILLQGLL
jgi:hypothetical protein